MTVYLAPHVHAANVGDDLVILDTRADAYYCVRQLGDVLSEDVRSLKGLSGGQVEGFRAAGLVGERPTFARPLPAHPNRGLVLNIGHPQQLENAPRMAAVLADLAVVYPFGSFHRLLSSVKGQRATSTQRPDPEIARLAGVFANLVLWAPVGRKCLVRSFLLRRFLERSGYSADWVFGVRTWPFGAHCWIQSGPLALDDAPERLAAYQPIFCL